MFLPGIHLSMESRLNSGSEFTKCRLWCTLAMQQADLHRRYSANGSYESIVLKQIYFQFIVKQKIDKSHVISYY